MKRIVVLSGKGGTGKTVFTASFAVLAKNKVIIDCDVDAANLYILLHPEVKEKGNFYGSAKAVIDGEKCVKCHKCREACRFEAINDELSVDEFACEGCGACEVVCEFGAVRMNDSVSGEWFVSETEYGPFVHARLHPAEGNSGLLVTEIRKRAEEIAEERNLELMLMDGPPGIGCPVIASLTGAALALIVTEPSLSGIHDMERVIEMCRRFQIKSAVVMNKFDLNLKNAEEVEKWCIRHSIKCIGRVPFDEKVVESVVSAKPFILYSENETAERIKNIWFNILHLVGEKV